MKRYWDYIENQCIDFVTQYGPCNSAPIIEELDQKLQDMGKTHLQVINDVTRALSDLSGNAPLSHGRKYTGGPPLLRDNGVYKLRDDDHPDQQPRFVGF